MQAACITLAVSVCVSDGVNKLLSPGHVTALEALP